MSASSKKSQASRARDVALYRYALIRPLADPGLSPAERGSLVRELAGRVHLGPFGAPVTVSRASLDRWIRAWRAGGFDALVPAERQVELRTDTQVLELAVRLKRERPARTAAHIVRVIEAEQGWAPSARTLQRHFARLELGTRPDGAAPEAFGRFEAGKPDELWVSDGLHGPIIEGKRAVLFALLDDHSRYVVGHRWGHGEDTLGLQAALHDAVKTHGCPQRLYADNGSAYSSHQLAWSAAVLDIKLVHSAPGRPQGRGKIERWNRTVRDQFLVEIDTTIDTPAGDGTGCESLADLNRLFTAWLHQQYHRARHSETGATPAERYHAAGRPVIPRPDPALLRRAFLWREQRKVTSFATISLHGNRYEVDAALTGRTIDALFTPFDLSIVEVEYQGRPMGQAILHQITRHVHPAVKPEPSGPIEATGIDYLRLLESAHHTEVGQSINFAALTDQPPSEHPAGHPAGGPQPGHEQA
ncbi:MAG: DDE-type integrase/transposase/recombinase [Pseudonocardia sp.]|nr:DDE-type integrase/transposase/recombinase [Pseudonocardia sp.]